MEDLNLKLKVKTLLQKATHGGRPDEDFRNWIPQGVALEAAERERRALTTHPIPLTTIEEDQVLDSVEKEYFNQCFDSGAHELQKYVNAGVPDQEEIDFHRQKLLKQLKVVTKRTFNLILEQRPRCAEEMIKIQSLSTDLDQALVAVRHGRLGLDLARQKFTQSSLGILAACKRRQRAAALVQDLGIISTLQKTDAKLQELLALGNYPGAIRLLIEGQKAVETFKHFTAIQQLSVKLQDTLEIAEESLDVALSKVCVDFDQDRYQLLVEAYALLGAGKTQSSMDQLLMHLTSAIHNTAWNVVYGHAVLSSQGQNPDDLSRKLYKDICTHVATSSLLPCLIDLCKSMWNIMNSFKMIVDFHSRQDDEYIQKKLNNGLTRIWQDVQTKIRCLIVSNEVADLTIDQFIRIIDVVHVLMEAGESFCGSTSMSLQESLKLKCLSYFQGYHLERMQDLRLHLINESWRICPVKDTFNLEQLHEFQSVASCTNSPKKESNRWPEKCPFDLDSSQNINEDFMQNSDDETSDEELKKDFIEEEFVASTPAKKRMTKSPPVITTTSLILLRLCGKYLHLMQMLRPIAADVFLAMTQLIEYYFVNVHILFSNDLTESHDVVTDAKFVSVMNELKQSLLVKQPENNPGSLSINKTTINNFLNETLNKSSTDSQNNVVEPADSVEEPTSLNLELASLNPSIELSQPELLHGLEERYVAAESVIYVLDQIKAMKRSICRSVANPDQVNDYFSNKIEVMTEVRRSIFMAVATKCLNSESILKHMAKVSWDVKEVQSQHNQYVDILLREVQIFSMRLQELNVKFSEKSLLVLWEMMSFACGLIFVEGFSDVKRCNNEGRALMQLDYRQFAMKLEKICDIKPVPHQDYVVQYIKAYYIPEAELDSWVKYHTEYSAKQLVSLVNTVAYSNNKTKQRLNSLMNEFSGKIRKQTS